MDGSIPGLPEELGRLGPADPSVLIGIIDGVPDLSPPELGGLAIETETSMLPDESIEPDTHGTEICALVFGSEHGLAHGCAGLILPVFFTGGGRTSPRASQMDVARALYMAVERGAAIVNVSAGQMSATTEAGRHLEDAVNLCHRHRILIAAAAGNDGCACLHVPAAVPTVLAVGAMDAEGRPIEQSNWGHGYSSNGILAPGADIEVTSLGGTRVRRTGTSYATAVVSAVAARLLSAARRAFYALDALDIRSILIDSADPCDQRVDGDCARILAGKLNVAAAIQLMHQRGQPDRDRATVDATQRRLLNVGGGLKMTSALLADGTVEISSRPTPPITPAAGVEQLACSCGGGGTCNCGKGKGGSEEETDGVATSALSPETAKPTTSVTQQACSCESKQPPQIVYSIGALWFDFGSEARYDAIVQKMNDPVAANNPPVLFGFLSENLAFASGITFILMQDQIPVYAVQPAGPFALDIYRDMLDAMRTSLDPTGDLQRVAIPGLVSGTTRLMNGMTLPVVYPDARGMVKWRASDLAAAAKAAVGDEAIEDASISNFLVRVYDELRNFGINAEERAMNYAATNAYQAATAFADGAKRQLELYRIGVKKSPICRPDSDCWDVQLVMFDPENERRAGRFYRFTVDVSEVLPVTVGTMRTWSAPLGAI
jgi:cyanobactin maturation PatA/PatG family protease